jgi:uncharacterized protein YdbL (DUF1318 family)
MSAMHRRSVVGAGAAVIGVALAGGVLGQTPEVRAKVHAAKLAGVIGEQADGLLGLVKGDADADTKHAMAEINDRRIAVYREAADRNGVSVEAAGAAAFESVIKERLQPGEFYKPEGSGWVRK